MTNGYSVKRYETIKFPVENDIIYFQDHGWWKGVTSEIEFYPRKLGNNDSIWLIGDGYGIQQHHGLPGKYGNGSICIHKKELPIDVWEWCLENQIEPVEK